MKVYISKSYQYLETKFDVALSFGMEVTAKTPEVKIPLGYIGFDPIPGIEIGLLPYFSFEADGKVELSGKVTATLGAAVSSDSREVRNLSSAPKFKGSIKGEMTVFIGIGLQPQITILHEAVGGVELSASAGTEIKASMSLYDTSASSSKVHACSRCIDGDITGKVELKFETSLWKFKQTYKYDNKIKVADFYYSFDHNEFAFTSCPHYRFKTNITVVDGSKKAVAGAKIAAKFGVNKNDAKESVKDSADFVDVDYITANQDGKAVGYLTAGKHTLSVAADGFRTTLQKIEVADDAKSVRIVLWKDGQKTSATRPSDGSSIGDSSDENDSSGGDDSNGEVGNGTNSNQRSPIKVLDNVKSVSLGEGYSGAITKDGSLYMWGYNNCGQVGNGTNSDQLDPTIVLNNAESVSLGWVHSGVITRDGSLYMWGHNGYGQVGNGATSYQQLSPIKIELSQELSVALNTLSDSSGIHKIKSVSNPENTSVVSGSAIISNEMLPSTDTVDLTQTKSFSKLTSGSHYNFYVMKSRTAPHPFSADNLLYISQHTASNAGTVDVSYIPKETIDSADAFVVGMSQMDLSAAQMTVSDLNYTGSEQTVWPTVSYQGTVLTEGVDYEVIGDFRVTDTGNYQVAALGIGLYTGEVTGSYQVRAASTQPSDSTGGSTGSYYPLPSYPSYPSTPSITDDNATTPPQAEPDTSQTQQPPEQGDNASVPGEPDAVVYKKGDHVTDMQSNSVYEITKLPYSNGTGGTVSYLKPVNKTVSSITVPETIMLDDTAYKVTAISDNAFKNHTYLTKAVIGNNVINIGSSAFYGCKKLKTVSFGTRVTVIGAKAFCKCTALTQLTLADKTAVIRKPGILWM